MAKPKALATRQLFDEARAILERQLDVEYWPGPERITRAELLQHLADKDALICLPTEKVDEELLAAAPKLRIAATVSVGYDNIDVPACTRRRVIATNTPGVLDDTTADFAWTLLMAVSRRLIEGESWVRSGTWPGMDIAQLLGQRHSRQDARHHRIWANWKVRGVTRPRVSICACSITTAIAWRPRSKPNCTRNLQIWTVCCANRILFQFTCL